MTIEEFGFNPFTGKLDLQGSSAIWVARSLVNGSFQETFDALVTSNGTVVTMSLEQAGTGDLVMQFSDGNTALDCTPALTIALTVGSDTSPTENFIYILQSTKVLTKSTSNWPSTEHIKIGFFYVPSAIFVQATGVYVNQNWNDHLSGTNNQGHLLHMAERSRRLGAQYFSGVDGNGTTSYLTIVANGGAADNVFFKSTSGIVYQMHKHTISAMDTSGTDKLLVINQHTNNGGAFDEITDLNVLLKDANDVSMSGKYFNLTFIGIANKTGEFAPFLVNLPTGSYNGSSDATNDVSGFTVTSVPTAFNKESSTAFEIAVVTLRHQPSSSGTWTHIATKDLRGLSFAGAGAGVSVLDEEFADNKFKIFDEADTTKVVAFDVGTNITTATTRTFIFPDVDDTLAVIGTDNLFTASQTFTTVGDTALTITAGTANNAIINFGDTALGTIGAIDYDNNIDTMLFRVSSATRMTISSTAITPSVSIVRSITTVDNFIDLSMTASGETQKGMFVEIALGDSAIVTVIDMDIEKVSSGSDSWTFTGINMDFSTAQSRPGTATEFGINIFDNGGSNDDGPQTRKGIRVNLTTNLTVDGGANWDFYGEGTDAYFNEFVRFGTTGAGSHSLGQSDSLFGADVEIDGTLYTDGNIVPAGTVTALWDVDVAGVALDVQNTTDAVSNQIAIFKSGNRGTPTDNDEGYISFYSDNSAGDQAEFVRLTSIANDVTSTSRDSTFLISLYKNNTFGSVVEFRSSDFSLTLNPSGFSAGGKFFQFSKESTDVIHTINTQTLDRGGGTGGAGFGLRWLMRLENGSGARHDTIKIEGVWTDSTNTTEDADMIFSTMTNGSFSGMIKLSGGTNSVIINTALEIDGALNHDGSTVGFFAVAPASQPAHIVDADGTLADITTKFNALLAQVAILGLQAAS